LDPDPDSQRSLDPDPDVVNPDKKHAYFGKSRSRRTRRRFDDYKAKKLQLKKFVLFFGLHEKLLSHRRSLRPPERDMKHEISSLFPFILVIFSFMDQASI
jgi:hypothetical protein